MSTTGLLFTGSGNTQNQQQHPKDSPVPNELLATVDQFKTFLSEQKKIREDLVNMSTMPLVNLKDDLVSMLHQVSSVTSGIRHISAQCDRLKESILKEEKSPGIAQRLSEPGTNLQLDHNATTEYFMTKLGEFDQQLKLFKEEMDVMEQHITSQSQQNLTPKDLVALLKRLDDEFMTLASQLYQAYERVRVLKSQYMRKRRILGDGDQNPFAQVEDSSLRLRRLEDSLNGTSLLMDKKLSTRSLPYGPSPFTLAPIAPYHTQQPLLMSSTQPGSFPGAAINAQTAGLPSSGLFSGLSTLGKPAVTTSAFNFGLPTVGTQRPAFGLTASSTVSSAGSNWPTMSVSQSPFSGPSTFGLTGLSSTGSTLFGKK